MELGHFDTPIGPRIEQALLRHRYESGKDLTWKELGRRVWDRLGRGTVDTSKVSRIKTGEQQPTIAEGGAFAYELDVSPVWLFWEIGEMGRFPIPVEPPPDGDSPVPTASVAPVSSYEEQRAAKKAGPKRRAQGGG